MKSTQERVLIINKGETNQLLSFLNDRYNQEEQITVVTADTSNLLPLNDKKNLRYIKIPTDVKKHFMKIVKIAVRLLAMHFDRVIVLAPSRYVGDIRVKVLAFISAIPRYPIIIPSFEKLSRCMTCGDIKKELLWYKSGYAIVSCSNCGMVYTGNPPDQSTLNSCYDSAYEKQSSNAEKVAVEKRKQAKQRLEMIESLSSKGRLLDIGCSFGFFLDEARERGWETYGLEISKPTYEFARTTLNLNVHNKLLQEAGFESNWFDVVCMWDVLEHLLEPDIIARECARILKPEGLLCLTVPNIESRVAKACKKHWGWMIPPLHLNYFSPKTLTRFLQNYGFKIELIKTEAGDSVNEIYLAMRGYAARATLGLFKSLTHPVYQETKVSGSLYKITRRLRERIWNNGKGAEILAIAKKKKDSA